jgi:hypothetical protein
MPFLYGSFIHDSKPVYPGALNKLLVALPETDSPPAIVPLNEQP